MMWCQWERAAFDDGEFESDAAWGIVHKPKAGTLRHTVDGDLCRRGTTQGPDVTTSGQPGVDVVDTGRSIEQRIKPEKSELE
jgi:hypothetical protein